MRTKSKGSGVQQASATGRAGNLKSHMLNFESPTSWPRAPLEQSPSASAPRLEAAYGSIEPKGPHPALQNQDVLLAIFSQARIHADHDRLDAFNDTVAKCARVCQAFREPALQVLWERLPSILPLLLLLAPNFRSIDGGHKAEDKKGVRDYNAYVLREIPDTEQWARFCEYARRVRILNHSGKANAGLESNSSTRSSSPEPLYGWEPEFYHGANSGVEVDSTSISDRIDGELDLPDADEEEEDAAAAADVDGGGAFSGSDRGSNPLVDLFGATYIFPSVWYHLRRLAGNQPLLPTLRELDWTTEPDQTEIFMLVGPCLERLHLRIDPMYFLTDQEYDATLPLLVRTIASRAPNLKHFAATTPAGGTLRSVLPELHRMRKLRTVVMDTGSATGCSVGARSLRDARLDTLEDLGSLTLGLQVADDILDNDFVITLPSLCALTIVDYSGNTQAYKLFSVPALRSLDVTVRSSEAELPLYDALPAALARGFPGITSLALTYKPIATPSDADPPPSAVSLLHHIQPLFDLAGLRAFSLTAGPDMQTAISLRGAELRAILESWPLLASFAFSIPRSRRPFPQLDVSALVDVARHRPELKALHLAGLSLSQGSLDEALAAASATPVSPSNVSSSKLEVLTVAFVIDSDRNAYMRPSNGSNTGTSGRLRAQCARVVHALFPRLDVARCREGRVRPAALGYDWAWARVLDEVEGLRREMRG